MSNNWIRHFELMLLDNNGQGIALSDFKIVFNIEWFNIKFPRVATFKIYNLSTDTTNRIIGQEFSKVQLIAGYRGMKSTESEGDEYPDQNIGELFSGDIRYSITGKDNPTDTFILIQAADGHNAFINATINQTLASGYTLADVNALVMRNLSPYGITEGPSPDFGSVVFPRGKVFYGMTRDVITNIAAQCNATWQFVNGKRVMVRNDAYLHSAIVLNSKTGLIGMPQQTIGAGVNVRCLINPNIQVNGLIQLDQSSVYRAALSNSDVQMGEVQVGETTQNGNTTVNGVLNTPASIATDGVYIVKGIAYTGDTRGNEWYMDMMCLARGAGDLLSTSALSRST